MKNPEMLSRALGSRVWLLHEPWLLSALAEMPARIEANLLAPEPPRAARLPIAKQAGAGVVAVIPIRGVIEQGGGFFSMFFGGCSPEMIGEQLRLAINDPNVAAIVLDVDSPGGDVAGIQELAAQIFAGRKVKPITAVANYMMASAAYYLGAQANEVLASPSSLIGSIGVYMGHEDISQLLDNAGVKITLIHYGANKVEGNSYEPLSDGARAHLQDLVDVTGLQFEKDVARGRGVKLEEVQKKFGQGRVFHAQQAVRLGLADKVGTLDDALAKHGAARSTGMRGTVRPTALRAESSDSKQTKSVDGKECPKRCFAYRPDDDPQNWKLPIESPDGDREWEDAHIRNAISRWGQTDMPDSEEKKKARTRIRDAAKARGIEVGDDSLARAAADIPVPDNDQGNESGDAVGCTCPCDPCQSGDCDDCDCDGCDAEGCDAETCNCAQDQGAKAAADAERRRRQIALLDIA